MPWRSVHEVVWETHSCLGLLPQLSANPSFKSNPFVHQKVSHLSMHLWEASLPWTGKREEGLFFTSQVGTVSSSQGVSIVLALSTGRLWPPQGLWGRLWVASHPPCVLALYFIQRRAVAFFICLHTRFPRRSSFGAGLPGLSSASSSACQQAGRVHAPHWCWLWCTLSGNLTERSSVTLQWSLARCLPRPCLCLPYFHV